MVGRLSARGGAAAEKLDALTEKTFFEGKRVFPRGNSVVHNIFFFQGEWWEVNYLQPG